MPRNGKVPSLRHHKPSGLAVVTINGADVYCGKYGTPEAQATYDRVIGEWLASGRCIAATASTRGGSSVAELLVAYLQFCESYYAPPSTETAKIRRALRPIPRAYGHTAAKNFGPLALKAIRETFVDEGLSRRLVNQMVGRIVRCWKWGCENEMVPPATWQALQAVPGLKAGRTTARETPRVLPVGDDVFQATLEAIAIPQVRAILQLLRLTGARVGEICTTRTADIDRSGPVWTYSPTTHKTTHHGHERTIYIGPRAQEALTPWLRDDDPEAFCFQPAEAVAAQRQARKSPGRSDADRARAARNKRAAATRARGGKAAVPRPPADRYTPASIRRAIDRACKRAGIEHWHPHQLRHAAATELRREIGIEAARVVLGHRSASVAEIYAEADRGAAAEAMARYG